MTEADALARRVADAMLALEGTGPAWGITIDEAREGYARIRMTLRDDMLNGHRIAHGGMIFALADTAFAYACNSRNETSVAQNATISFLAPAAAGDELVAEAREASRSGRSGVYQVSVKTGEGAVIAEFTGLSRTIGGTVIN
ncbi:hydroxyphenylacetyl-CoA thioesterase PaaI [Terricaulis silvestris]|uniref:Acyl-coenzyme A thioesterase PaaI n=1 Tax=Terricaulis silvestris TaxID=2686094 RepID=A0A6I6MLH1_9CAUL|nr:hydroxyphenylacetyl-CoA thioesterase PaaI [Terricaulis silvestris]QGZ93844.1 Acyl-coenzyme A thioesterase PaaI [Terricaulis silvestris]